MFIFIISYLSRKDVAAFLELDQKVYSSQYQVSEEATLKRLAVNPLTDIIVKKEEQLVGYISLCPISDMTRNLIISNSISEEKIESEIVPYDGIGYYDAYLSSIVVDKEKFPKFPGRFLFIYLQNHINQLRKRGIFIHRVIAVAVSPAGRRSLIKMGFSELRKNIFYFNCLKQTSLFIPKKIIHYVIDALNTHALKVKHWGSV